MLKKNEEYIGTVVNLGANGEGVVKNGDFTVFVPFSITGEKIKYRVIKVSSKGNFGKLVEVIEPSNHRIEPTCDVFYKCGGCQLQHVDYDYQLQLKKNNVKNCFKKIANLDVCVDKIVVGSNIYNYRNKLQLPVGFDGVKNVFGFYYPNSHRIVDICTCPINPTWTKDIIAIIKEFMAKFNLKGLDNSNFSGDIREITVKEIGKSLIITIVGLKKSLRNKDDLINLLIEKLGYKFSLFYNFNNSTSNVIYSEDFSLLYGENEYNSIMNGITYSTGVRSFSQVNTEVCSLLYKSVVDNIFDKNESDITVFDAYSGAGIMTALIAQKANKVIGIEIVKEAVEIANHLMKINGLSEKVTNYVGKCEDILPDLIRKEREKSSKISVVIDPPRKGCEYKVIESIIKSNVDRICYVSCMPSTLARDIGLLVGSLEFVNGEIKKTATENYKPRFMIESCVPFEMFPQTKHIETLCVLKKVNY